MLDHVTLIIHVHYIIFNYFFFSDANGALEFTLRNVVSNSDPSRHTIVILMMATPPAREAELLRNLRDAQQQGVYVLPVGITSRIREYQLVNLALVDPSLVPRRYWSLSDVRDLDIQQIASEVVSSLCLSALTTHPAPGPNIPDSAKGIYSKLINLL